MLNHLSIENIAVIEKAEIDFSEGLNVLTGETGAGKSIVVDSINAVLGERTSKELVRHGADSAFVSAVFEGICDEVKIKLKELELADEDEDTLIITRKISSQGKSSCRVNGFPCTASMLRSLSSLLVNIHGQHDSQALLNPDLHYRFIDLLSDDVSVLNDYKDSFKHLVTVRRRLKELTADADDKDRQLELLNYEINELTEADIKIGEREALKNRRNIIVNSQSVINALNSILLAFNGDDEVSGIETLSASALKDAEGVAHVSDDLKNLYQKLIELNDISESVKDYTQSVISSVDYNEAELEQIEERLDILYRFSNKYGESEEEMLSYLENAQIRRDSIVNSDEELIKLNTEYDKAYEDALEKAKALSDYRKAVASAFENDVKSQLEFLDMPKIRFVVSFEKGNLSSNGYDKIEFLISTNPGEPPKPLAKIASGGELSRIMLAIKNILARKDSVQTLIFDEIDTGVSGRASRKIGLRLKSVSEHSQVICVTHSAQIASCADNHLLITKQFEDERTFTYVKSLSYEERKRELARIMGGMEITDTLLKSAEELLIDEKNNT